MRSVELGELSADIRPDLSKNNPRNSEGAFFTLKNGDILFAYSKFKGKSNADFASADICLLRSKDNGRSFGEEKTIMTCESEKAVNIMSLSFLEMKNGDVGLFYLVRQTYTHMRMYLRRSADGGENWSERILCMPENGYYVVNNDRVRRLLSGRIVIPAARHAVAEGYIDTRSESLFFYSDDDGENWKMAAGKCNLPGIPCCDSGLQEPGILELAPNILWGWARTDIGRQYEMFSHDGGDTWTASQPSRFTSPLSPLCMKRGWDENIYAIWNPVPVYNGREIDKEFFTGGRTPLVIAVSKDNGQTFTEPVAFEEEPDRGYCYCALHFTETSLLLAYCAGGKEDGNCLGRTVIRRIEKKQLEEKIL